MATHTPEPWGIIDHGEHDSKEIIGAGDDDEGALVCETVAGPYEEANARRIVAAVNACQGVSTEALEAGAVAKLVEACEAMLPRMKQAHAIRVKVTGIESGGMANEIAKVEAALKLAKGA